MSSDPKPLRRLGNQPTEAARGETPPSAASVAFIAPSHRGRLFLARRANTEMTLILPLARRANTEMTLILPLACRASTKMTLILSLACRASTEMTLDDLRKRLGNVLSLLPLLPVLPLPDKNEQ